MPWARASVCFLMAAAAVMTTGPRARAAASLTVDTYEDTYDGSDDTLLGEGGDDLLVGGPGTDVCRGGGCHDVARRCEIAS